MTLIEEPLRDEIPLRRYARRIARCSFALGAQRNVESSLELDAARDLACKSAGRLLGWCGCCMVFQACGYGSCLASFCITGLLGGLTTFSSFSAEVVSMLQNERYQWALATVALHVLGSLLMTVVGIRLVESWHA